LLDKPTILLKRQYIQDTTFKEEELNEGTKYEKKEGIVKNIDMLCDVKAMDYAKGKKRMVRSRRSNWSDHV
jgi:hypothetical protein